MGLLNTLTFDGVLSSDYGVFISGEGTFDAPERRGELINIPGRNGALFIDEKGFENIDVNYPAFIGSIFDGVFNSRLQNYRMELKSRVSYVRITDSYHPDEFRLGLYKSGIEVEPHFLNRSGDFTITFNCKPQRFLVSGETPVVFTANGTITNPTLFDALPLLKVKGNGTIEIEPYKLTVTGNTGELWIDSEVMESYSITSNIYPLTDENEVNLTDENLEIIEVCTGQTLVNQSTLVNFTDYVYPKINPGEIPVFISSGIEELTIIPRWWRL